MGSNSRTRYATAGDVEIAYQVLGEGPTDLLLYGGGTIPIDCVDDEPSLARFHRRLASFCRLLRFDRRGVGLSDRGSASAPPTTEQWVQDAVAMLDAVGSERATVLAPFIDSPAGLTLAAMHPDRVSGLVVINGAARAMWAPDYPDGIPQSLVDSLGMFRLGAEPDAVEQGYDILAVLAPSVAEDSVSFLVGSVGKPGHDSGHGPSLARQRFTRPTFATASPTSGCPRWSCSGQATPSLASGTPGISPSTFRVPSSSSFRAPTCSTGSATPVRCSTRSRSS